MGFRALIIAFAFGLTLLPACSDSDEPAATQQDTRIAHAYADLTLLSESTRLGMPLDTSRAYALQADSVLLIYGLTKEEFEKEFRRLADDPERSRQLFDLASKRIQAQRALRDSSSLRR